MNSMYPPELQHPAEALEPESGSATSLAHNISHGTGSGLIVSEEEVDRADVEPQQQIGHETVISRALDRLSRATWFSLIRRIFHYQNGREGSDLRLNPLNTGTWIFFELVLILSQIVSAVVILLLSRHEKPISPLRLWVIGHALGCCVSLPLLYWRYKHPYVDHNSTDQNPHRLRALYGRNLQPLPNSSHGEHGNGVAFFMERCRMSLDFFFAVWFVIGNVWVFGTRRPFSDEAPSLYKLCIALLALSCIGYALPFFLFAVLCCCMPCISTLLGYSVSSQGKENRGASHQDIAALPIYKFKSMCNVKGIKNGRRVESHEDTDDANCGGGSIIDSAGIRKRSLSTEDAECCICLLKYKDNELLKELSCSHLFHVGCVDQWLKINSSCPLCKRELVGSRNLCDHISRYELEERSRRVILDIEDFADR
ncbi:E3 ubiquitin-protein ligase At4g11680 isoform X2 [Cryptomeria japonica]|uniref:E3 ubiquitin-protein ligase At4g11680 isoform X2 n=1 Tax=Cryptomeria japonica TaxID=3369 RepID=UPI0025ABF619|nr:E3 ubiquitin-protein ligase At4g11680 isoform X2 [Cryptomeria japonica]